MATPKDTIEPDRDADKVDEAETQIDTISIWSPAAQQLPADEQERAHMEIDRLRARLERGTIATFQVDVDDDGQVLVEDRRLRKGTDHAEG